MKSVFSRSQSRELDRLAIEECGIPSLTLMENAGRGAADVIASLCEPNGRVLVVCGGGNNAGDGYVVARCLRGTSSAVRVVSLVAPARLKGDAQHNYQALVALSHPITICDAQRGLSELEDELRGLTASDVVVDALFGTGLDRKIEGHFARAIELLNHSSAKRVALDVPSGVCADTGATLGSAVLAHATVSFAGLKLGLCTSTGACNAGQVQVVDIGIPAELAQRVGLRAEVVEAADAAAWLKPRPLDVHKRRAGHVLCLAGSRGTSGAALLCAQGALRGGAGLVTLAGFEDTLSVLEPRVLEAMTARIHETQIESSLDTLLNSADSVVLGPGFGTGEREARVIRHVISNGNKPAVVDADAISCFSEQPGELAKSAGALVLTPHPGEMGRLLGISSAQVEADRFAAASRAASETRAVVVLKGPLTLIAQQGERTWINDAATPVLATAGSGDVLAGLIAAFACASEARHAAALGVYLHAQSGQLWQRRVGSDRGMLAREIADGIPAAIAELATLRVSLPD